MRLGIMPDTNYGGYDPEHPTSDKVANFMDEVIQTCLLAEDVGFDGIWAPERHMRTETLWPSPNNLLTTLAALTDDVTLGQYANVMTLYNPMQLAEELALIDNLSKGRLVWTPAMGFQPDYWEYMGIQDGEEKRLGRFVEGLEIVKKAWASSATDRFSFDGQHFQFDDVFQSPDPYQDPRPPIWPGAQMGPAIERAGREGDGLPKVAFPVQEETLKEQISRFKEASEEHGNPGRTIFMRDAYVAESQEKAEEIFGPIYREEMLYYFRHGIVGTHPDFETEDDFTIENLRDHIVIGSPEDCIEQLAEYEEKYGFDYCIMRFRIAKGPDHDVEREAVELFGDEVVPYFHEEDDGEWLLNR